jgi:hypothetical protein
MTRRRTGRRKPRKFSLDEYLNQHPELTPWGADKLRAIVAGEQVTVDFQEEAGRGRKTEEVMQMFECLPDLIDAGIIGPVRIIGKEAPLLKSGQ